MKRIVALLIFAVIMLPACNKNSIFDGSDKLAMLPVEASVALGSDNKDFFNSSAFIILGPEVLNNFIKENGEIDVERNENNKWGDIAIVINDSHLLGEYQGVDGSIFEWPQIDFGKYSLVIGRYSAPDTGCILSEHRAKKGLFRAEIFLHIIRGAGFTVPMLHVWGALYPKLPSGPAKVTRWEDNTAYQVQ